MKVSQTIKIAVDNNLPCLLVGNHGTGKSYAIREAAMKKKANLIRVIVTQETTPEDLVYQYELEDGKTTITKRELLKAVENGDWIVLEELNMASPAVLTMLNGLLETDPESRYLRFRDEEIKPSENFRLFATSNPTSYSGANRMNDALLSRFIVNRVEPDYKAFLKIVKKDYCEENEELYKELKNFVSGIDKVQKNYQMYISPRELINYALIRSQGYKREQAVSFVLDRFYDLDKDIMEDIASIFSVESDRDDVLILNEAELNRKIDDAKEELNVEVQQLRKQIEDNKNEIELFNKIKESMSQSVKELN